MADLTSIAAVNAYCKQVRSDAIAREEVVRSAERAVAKAAKRAANRLKYAAESAQRKMQHP